MTSVERKQKIKRYGNGFDLLKETLRSIPRKAWKFKPSAADWSIHEVIIHLADSEAMAAMRIRTLAAEPGRTIMAYDQDKWAVNLNYQEQDVDDALRFLKYIRKTTYKLLKSLPDPIFNNTVIHPERDTPFGFDRWLSIYPEHIPSHIDQINNNYKIWKEQE